MAPTPSVTCWKACHVACVHVGRDPTQIRGWGRRRSMGAGGHAWYSAEVIVTSRKWRLGAVRDGSDCVVIV